MSIKIILECPEWTQIDIPETIVVPSVLLTRPPKMVQLYPGIYVRVHKTGMWHYYDFSVAYVRKMDFAGQRKTLDVLLKEERMKCLS